MAETLEAVFDLRQLLQEACEVPGLYHPEASPEVWGTTLTSFLKVPEFTNYRSLYPCKTATSSSSRTHS